MHQHCYAKPAREFECPQSKKEPKITPGIIRKTKNVDTPCRGGLSLLVAPHYALPAIGKTGDNWQVAGEPDVFLQLH
jgi:hypothetical protein